MRPEYFFGFMISFILGVGLESIFNFGPSLGVLCVFLSPLLFLLFQKGTGGVSRFLVSLLFLGCAVGIFRVDVSHLTQNENTLASFVGNTVTVQGIVTEEPDVRETYTNIVLKAQTVLYEKKEYVLDSPLPILVRVPAYPEFYYGDHVQFVGKVAVPENFAPSLVNREKVPSFDYKTYLAKDGIYYQMFFPKAELIAQGDGKSILERLFSIKRWLMENITSMVPEPESSLAGGITLGTKQSLGDDLLQKFRETGVAHIVVLSGYNIAVVAGIISRMMIFLHSTLRLGLSAVGVILFAMMVGGGATVVRATIMALIIILARVLGREGDALRALVLAGAIMIFMNPMILLFDVSFQLSFSATLALIIFVPVIEKYFLFIPSVIFREILVTTIATQIFVLPLILYHMGSVSLIGLVANIFILPVIPLAMLLVSLVALFAGIPFVGGALAFMAYGILAYVISAVLFFASVPFASLSGISFPPSALLSMYIIFSFLILRHFHKTQQEEKSAHEF
ncbi:hypothetical protein AUJ77_01280 [Candidatus Nomurabacteria bacterium CG1_02_43_90]|uniref:ComEC/Rec2-related protein domain-containing protein n=1 Tax=Candidatus Nomurabacteria bacterium CG1_02_43_90 TaxID=1805281 RepID=A0A1J4V4N8_9BACT|nr:MAG: hypothetical protein AUJ77_01280 [Candidatus Nomurabacteria bacterium CG1_02_43_90]